MNKGERAHSKFSASGAERWFNCPGSVALSEGQPDKTSVWAEEGTLAHKVLETIMRRYIKDGKTLTSHYQFETKIPPEMLQHCISSSDFILNLYEENRGSELKVETRIYLDFIHPEMFGTFDGAVIDHFGTLHVYDFKYGAGHAVSPVENLQMIFYGIGLAYRYEWNFKKVRLWIDQPRIKGFDGPAFWDVPILDLKKWVDIFKVGVLNVQNFPNKYIEGEWCWWCKAKSVCPLKLQAKIDNAKDIFSLKPIDKKTNSSDFY